jgi:cytochrome c peroxidase
VAIATPAGEVFEQAAPVAFPGNVRVLAARTLVRPTTGPASRFEWRTPPLWGFRDSGPYLHDGRADTLDQAVALHGGEAARIAQNFFQLKPGERRQVEAFLKSLTAPDPAPVERVASAR